MSDDPKRSQEPEPDATAAADDAAAALEGAEIERNDGLVDEEAALDSVTIPASAPIDQPAPLPVDGLS